MKTTGTSKFLMLAGVLLIVLAGCNREAAVSYSQDVKPIIQANCLSCHEAGGAGYEASGFSMESYDDLMQGTKFGPMIVAGDSAGSNMIVLMEGRADPSISMPHGDMDPVRKKDIEIIKTWIDQGAKKN
jgi:uncharacterized membrane protein